MVNFGKVSCDGERTFPKFCGVYSLTLEKLVGGDGKTFPKFCGGYGLTLEKLIGDDRKTFPKFC